MMTPERFERVRELYLRVVAEPPERRAGLARELAGAGGDASLAGDVIELLGPDDDGAAWAALPTAPGEVAALRAAAVAAADDGDDPVAQVAALNDALRPADGSPPRYVALEKLGEGGMGAVFRCEQRAARAGEIGRRAVALKVIGLGMNSKQVVARFGAERQALALMSHPNIASVFDAGLLADGRPFFAMEHVPGRPVTEFADAHRLTIEQRLSLFQQVCDAVQHAHAKAVIHRDIKPANVLAFMDGDAPRAKVIDFGIAKAVAGGRLAEQTVHTRADVAVGTWAYMSPEQAAGDPDIDVRTDVYALGVLLYELLAGANPFDFKTLAEAEIRRVIRETDPPRPDTRLGGLTAAGASAVATGRGVGAAALRQRLAGELGWIPLKALRKVRGERYETAAALRADVERYLAGRPLVAGPDSAAYRVRKYVRRNRGAVAAGLTIVTLLVGGVAGSATGWRRAAANAADERAARVEADRQRAAAVEQQAKADAVLAFLTGEVFAGATPDRMPDAKVRDQIVKSMIDPAAAKVAERFGSSPRVEAAIRHTIASLLGKLGRFDAALREADAALAIRERLSGPDDADAAESAGLRAGILRQLGRATEAEARYRELVARLTRTRGPDDPRTLAAWSGVAAALDTQQRHAEALEIYRDVLERRRKLLGSDSVEGLVSLSRYAGGLVAAGRVAEAERLEKEALDGFRRVLGPDREQSMDALTNWANTLRTLGRDGEAESAFLEALERSRRVRGVAHPSTAWLEVTYAYLMYSKERYAQAEPLYGTAAATLSAALGPDHLDVLTTRVSHANTLAALGRHAEAEPVLRDAVERLARSRGDGDRDARSAADAHARVLASLGRTDEAAAVRARYGLAK